MLYDIPIFLTYVRSEYLFELKQGQGYYTPATVFAISICSGETIKFQILTDDRTLFSNIPVSALANDKVAPKYQEEQYVCTDDIANIIQHEYLTAIEHCAVWKQDNSFWQKAIYILTIEFPKTKQQLHLLEMEDGNYTFAPNENITWGEDHPNELPYSSIE